MFNMNKMIMIAVLAMAVVAIAGVADARSVNINVKTIQTNGNYIGVPTQITGELYHWGYNYTFTPDGTYTVSGTLTNTNNKTSKTVWVDADSSLDTSEIIVNVPAAVDHYYTVGPLDSDKAYGFTTSSSVDFSITLKAASEKDIAVWYGYVNDDDEWQASLSDTDYTNSAEGQHTIDYGPMSNMVVVYTNGKIQTNSSLDFGLNQTSSDINAYYSTGKFDFKNSPLYSFL